MKRIVVFDRHDLALYLMVQWKTKELVCDLSNGAIFNDLQ